MSPDYSPQEPPRAEVDKLAGPTLLDFGNSWCGYCRGAAPRVEAALASHPGVRHIRVADGPGKPLGRSFRVKLWPTLIFLDGGREVARLVRPQAAEPVAEALQRIDPR
jgi:thioredoxin 1